MSISAKDAFVEYYRGFSLRNIHNLIFYYANGFISKNRHIRPQFNCWKFLITVIDYDLLYFLIKCTSLKFETKYVCVFLEAQYTSVINMVPLPSYNKGRDLRGGDAEGRPRVAHC